MFFNKISTPFIRCDSNIVCHAISFNNKRPNEKIRKNSIYYTYLYCMQNYFPAHNSDIKQLTSTFYVTSVNNALTYQHNTEEQKHNEKKKNLFFFFTSSYIHVVRWLYHVVMSLHSFLYKTLFYKNAQAEIKQNFKKILRTYPG